MKKYDSKKDLLNRIKKNIGLTINENIINEIDWENRFNDVSKECLSIDELVRDLNIELKRLSVDGNKREKLSYNKPIISKTYIPLTNEGNIDVEEFINNITKEPLNVFSLDNSKMKKTDKGKQQLTINTGLPALRGIVYDEENKKFYYINTCPGAGKCQVGCYARKGSYIRIPQFTLKLTRRLNFFLNHPDKYEEKLIKEIQTQLNLINPNSTTHNNDFELKIRWNDAGDFFTNQYFSMARRITKIFQKQGYNISSYAYTKIGKYVNFSNDDFIINFSQNAAPKEREKVNLETSKTSIRVPIDLFKDLFLRNKSTKTGGITTGFAKNKNTGITEFIDQSAPLKYKERISKKYNVPLERLKYTWELPQEIGKRNEFDVIVLPSDSDVGAQRTDVRISFLSTHR